MVSVDWRRILPGGSLSIQELASSTFDSVNDFAFCATVFFIGVSISAFWMVMWGFL